MRIQRPCRVHMPAGFRHSRRRIRPPVANQLIDSFQKVLVGERLEIKRRGTEGKRMDPRPRLGGNHRYSIMMPCGRRPARSREVVPVPRFIPLLALRKVNVPVAGELRGRIPIGLHSRQHVVLVTPGLKGFKEVFVQKLGERLPPIMPHEPWHRSVIRLQCGQIRYQIVSAPLLKLLQKT